jgi:hypothetical protein
MDETERQPVSYEQAAGPEIYVAAYPPPAYAPRIGMPPLVPRPRPTRRSTRGWQAAMLALCTIAFGAGAILWSFQTLFSDLNTFTLDNFTEPHYFQLDPTWAVVLPLLAGAGIWGLWILGWYQRQRRRARP